MARMTRAAYAATYGPTTGDLVRLGDTSTHGGAVTGSSSITKVNDIFQARLNDEFTCAISSHNPATVGPGFQTVAVDENMDVAKEMGVIGFEPASRILVSVTPQFPTVELRTLHLDENTGTLACVHALSLS